MKKLLISLLLGVSLFSVGCSKEVKKEVDNGETKELTAYEINSITSLRKEVTGVEQWYLYYGESEIKIAQLKDNQGLVEKGTIFSWGYSFDSITKNDEGLFEADGSKLVEFNYRDVVFNDLDQVISEEFMTNEKVSDDDLFLGVFEITEVTEDKVYLDVKKTVLCKWYFDVYEGATLVEIY